MRVIKWGNTVHSSSEVSLFYQGNAKNSMPHSALHFPFEMLPTTDLKVCHDTLHSLECVCVCVRPFCHKLAITVCTWSYDFLYYFTFEISVCVCACFSMCCLHILNIPPHVSTTSASTFCVCWCVLHNLFQPMIQCYLVSSSLHYLHIMSAKSSVLSRTSVSQRLTGSAFWGIKLLSYFSSDMSHKLNLTGREENSEASDVKC